LAEVGATYQGKVVNITKFGAFVNILPGRDGLLHISKIGQGKRVERVEDVLELGQPIEVRVDDIDPQGKVSLSLAGEAPVGNGSEARNGRGDGGGGGGGRGDGGGGRRPPRGDHSDPGDRPDRSRRQVETTSAPTGAVSFEDAFEVELVQEFGDLGPAVTESSERPSGGGRGGRRRR
jgi:polyribonucleotide nucleotidyltransferase